MKRVFVLAGALALSASAALAGQEPITSALHCWNVGSMSREAARTTVTVGFNLREDGTVQPNSIRSLDPGSSPSYRQAFEAAKRAILRCGTKGYQATGPQALSFGPGGVFEVRQSPVEA